MEVTSLEIEKLEPGKHYLKVPGINVSFLVTEKVISDNDVAITLDNGHVMTLDKGTKLAVVGY